MLQRNFKEKRLSITKRETNRCTPLMTTLRNRIMQLSLSFDRLINSWLSLVTTSRSLIKGERKKKRKRKLVTCVRRIEAIRLLKLRWTIDREREEGDVYPNLWRIHGFYVGLRMHISQKFERFRVPHWNIFNRIGRPDE